MSAPVDIREATPADAPGIQEIARRSCHAAYDDLLGESAVRDLVASWYDPERLVTDDIRPGDRPLFVADRAGTLVGFAEARPAEVEDRLAHLYRIYVAPEWWGDGVGSALLDRLEAVLAEQGFDRLRVSVLADNDIGVQFYERKAFTRIETSTDRRFDLERYTYEKQL